MNSHFRAELYNSDYVEVRTVRKYYTEREKEKKRRQKKVEREERQTDRDRNRKRQTDTERLLTYTRVSLIFTN